MAHNGPAVVSTSALGWLRRSGQWACLSSSSGRDVDDVKIALCPYANPGRSDHPPVMKMAGVDQVIMADFVPGQAALERVIVAMSRAWVPRVLG